jgi:hypothetical protein
LLNRRAYLAQLALAATSPPSLSTPRFHPLIACFQRDHYLSTVRTTSPFPATARPSASARDLRLSLQSESRLLTPACTRQKPRWEGICTRRVQGKDIILSLLSIILTCPILPFPLLVRLIFASLNKTVVSDGLSKIMQLWSFGETRSTITALHCDILGIELPTTTSSQTFVSGSEKIHKTKSS